MPDEIRVTRHWLTRRWKAKLPDGGAIALSRRLTIDEVMGQLAAAFPEANIDIRDGGDRFQRWDDALLRSARAALPAAQISEQGGRVVFRQDFTTPEGQEPHDVAWDLRGEITERLTTAGLVAVDVESDHDTVWGYVDWPSLA